MYFPKTKLIIFIHNMDPECNVKQFWFRIRIGQFNYPSFQTSELQTFQTSKILKSYIRFFILGIIVGQKNWGYFLEDQISDLLLRGSNLQEIFSPMIKSSEIKSPGSILLSINCAYALQMMALSRNLIKICHRNGLKICIELSTNILNMNLII